jgi:hypothetical protein
MRYWQTPVLSKPSNSSNLLFAFVLPLPNVMTLLSMRRCALASTPYVALVVAPPSAVQRVATRHQLIRVANAVFDIALRSSSLAATALLRSLQAVLSMQLVPLAERWLELASSNASDAVTDLCCRALRQLAPTNANSPELVARVLSALRGARAARDSRLLRMYLLIVCDLFASPPTLDAAATDAWLDLFESLRADAEQSRAAFDALGELVDSVYAHFVRHLSSEMRAATLDRLATASTEEDAFAVVARHALLCECVASPPPSALDRVNIAAAVLDGVAVAHAAAQRAAGERALLHGAVAPSVVCCVRVADDRGTALAWRSQ